MPRGPRPSNCARGSAATGRPRASATSCAIDSSGGRARRGETEDGDAAARGALARGGAALARGARVRELTCAEQDVLELAMRRGPGGDANGLSLSSTCYVGHGAVVVAPGRGTLGRPW